MNVIKRDGRKSEFESYKIYDAVLRAAKEVKDNQATLCARDTAMTVEDLIHTWTKESVTVDQIHNLVEKALMKTYPAVAKAYILFRNHRSEVRETSSSLMKIIDDITKEMKPDNANVGSSAAAKMYSIAEAACKQYTFAKLLDPVSKELHQNGTTYINDLGYFPHTVNCFYSPMGKILRTGFNNGVGYIRPPQGIGAAMALAAIVLQSCQNEMFGGQGVVSFDTDLAPYMLREYDKLYIRYEEEVDQVKHPDKEKWVEEKAERICYQACEAFIYNMNTMRSRSGAQVTFSSINLGTDTDHCARMITRNILKAYIAGLGNGENPIFPNIGFRVKKEVNVLPGTPNYDLYQLAIECTSKRIQPRFVYCDSPMHKAHWQTAAAMGCRTAVISDVNGTGDPNARGNLAFNTISLPMVALDVEAQEVGKAFKERVFIDCLMNTCDKAILQLYNRYQVMKKLKVRDMPFVSKWYQGCEGLGPNDSIEPMIRHGSLSMGFVGLAECLKVLTGCHHGEFLRSQALGLELIEMMRNKTDEATRRYGLNFSLFASPAESSCYTLLRKARDKYGVIVGVTDKEHFTNSFHLPVGFQCDIETKIDTEAPYHQFCNAGAIMYVELGSSPKHNLEGVERVITYMAQSGASYGGVNFVHYFCEKCNYQGDMPSGSCPVCGNTEVRMTAIITGYLSTQDRFNPGKQDELEGRVSHGGGGPING